jgi:hypothetical protein
MHVHIILYAILELMRSELGEKRRTLFNGNVLANFRPAALGAALWLGLRQRRGRPGRKARTFIRYLRRALAPHDSPGMR